MNDNYLHVYTIIVHNFLHSYRVMTSITVLFLTLYNQQYSRVHNTTTITRLDTIYIEYLNTTEYIRITIMTSITVISLTLYNQQYSRVQNTTTVTRLDTVYIEYLNIIITLKHTLLRP